MKKAGLFSLSIVVLFFAMSVSVFGQARSAFNGRVTDSSGAVIPRATVVVTNAETGVARQTETNGDGLYNVPALDSGVYDIRVEATGLTPQSTKGVKLVVGTTISVDFKMSVEAVSQEVNVTGEAPLVETTQSTQSAALQHTEVQELPMLNRSLDSLVALTPGVGEEVGGGVSAETITHTFFTIGGNSRGTMVVVDGLDNHDDVDGGTATTFTLEGIEEFKVLTHGFSAEYGKSAGGVVTEATKSGTNRIHGSAFGYGRSAALTKIDYFSDPAHGGLGKNPYDREQYGGAVGGPIKKDRAWYFAGIERVSQRYSVPISPTIYGLEQLLTPANLGYDANVLATASNPTPSRTLLANGKVNFQLSQNHSAWVRYSHNAVVVENTPSPGIVGASSPITSDHIHTNNIAFAETWLISPTKVNQFSWQYFVWIQESPGTPCPTSGVAGVSTTGLDQCLLENLSFPSGLRSGSGLFGPEANVPSGRHEKKYQYKDDFSTQAGKNSFKFGADYLWIPLNGGTSAVTPGSITFFDDPDVIVNNTNGKYPQGFKTPGIVKSIARGTRTLTANTEYGALQARWQFGLYAQDDLKITPRLTLNLGVRYDIQSDFDKDNLPNNRVYQILKAIGSPYGALPRTVSYHSVGPRVGLAWDVRGNGKDVVRAGYGIFYPSRTINQHFAANHLQHPYLNYTQTTTDTAVGVGPLKTYVLGNAASLDALAPAPPTNPTTIPAGANLAGGWYDPNIKDQYEQITHAGYTRAINEKTTIAVDYTHILGIHEWAATGGNGPDINPICPTVAYYLTGPCQSPGSSAGPAAPGTRILTPALVANGLDPTLLSAITLEASQGRSQYNEMAVAFQRRSNRVTLQASYVLSYAYGYGGNVGGVGGQGAGAGVQPEIGSAYGGCMTCAGQWGPGAGDQRHRVTIFGVFNLPMGFDLAPTFTVASALPYTQYRSANNPNGDGSLRCFVGTCNVGTPGVTPEVGINAARGQPLVNLSARVSKGFKLGESKELKGFVEFFNIPNRANFGSRFGTTFGTKTFNMPTGYIGGAGSGSTIPNSFQIQLGARFSF